MISARLNGLWTLGILICLMAFLSDQVPRLLPHPEMSLVLLMLMGTLGYSVFARKFLNEPLLQQMRAAPYSFGIQLCLIICSYMIITGLGEHTHVWDYIILLMLSCIVAMLPISIGGIGVRELILLQGSHLLLLSEQTGVTMAFTFTTLSLTTPIVGALIQNLYPSQSASKDNA